MPALADMHVHFWDPSEANLFLANGIAHVRNMWGTPLHLAWRQKVAKREVAGPRVTTTGPIVDGAGPDGKTIWPGSVLLAAPEDAGPLVKRLADRGYAQVKALSALQLEPLRALCAAAKTRGIPVTGHCPRVVLYEEAIDAGMRCFEHFAAIEVPLAPLDEQGRIVAKLGTLLGKVDACQRRAAKIPILLKRFRQSVLVAACSGRLTADCWQASTLARSFSSFATMRRCSGRGASGIFNSSKSDLLIAVKVEPVPCAASHASMLRK